MRVSIFSLVGALFLLLFIGFVGSGETVVTIPPAATSTGLATVPAPPPLVLNLPDLSVPISVGPATSTPPAAATSTTKTVAKKKPTPTVVTPPPAAPTPQAPEGDITASAASVRNALVNILCYANIGSGLSSISGSGILISPRGIILTNAHIGQYFLLADKGVRCVIRTGGPAVDTYTAALIFISPHWVTDNAAVITEANPVGTGEYDFALLAVTGSAKNSSLPSSYPFVPLEENSAVPGEPVVIGSYAAQFLAAAQIQSALYPTIVYGSVKNIYTFGTNTIDVVSLGGSAAAQEGSSGGGALDAAGELTATITTSTIESDTALRTLSAITATYIRRDYAQETGTSLNTLLAQDTDISVEDYAPVLPGLEAKIVANLPH